MMTELYVKTVYSCGKTIVSDCFFTSPCKIAKPFYREDGYTEVMVMCASPGILAGDKYNMRFEMSDNTKTIISEQSYRKLYNTGADFSEQNTCIQIGESAVLHYVPYPVIPFEGSRFYSQTDISLHPSSKLIFGDIFTCGRHGMGEQFAFNDISSRTIIYIEDKPIFLDNCRMTAGEADFSGIGFFEGFTCQGMFYLYGFESLSLPNDDEIQGAVSKSSAGYTVRLFGNSAASLYQFACRLFYSLLS